MDEAITADSRPSSPGCAPPRPLGPGDFRARHPGFRRWGYGGYGRRGDRPAEQFAAVFCPHGVEPRAEEVDSMVLGGSNTCDAPLNHVTEPRDVVAGDRAVGGAAGGASPARASGRGLFTDAPPRMVGEGDQLLWSSRATIRTTAAAHAVTGPAERLPPRGRRTVTGSPVFAGMEPRWRRRPRPGPAWRPLAWRSSV